MPGRPHPHARPIIALALTVGFLPSPAAPASVLDRTMHHIRSGGSREWESFPEQAEADHLALRFAGQKNDAEWSLRLRQRDVKQAWRVRLNDRDLGPLVQDENEMVVYLPVPPGAVRDGDNDLRVACGADAKAASDDVSVGEVELFHRPRAEVLGACGLKIEVVDGATDSRTPCRITLADRRGGLVTIATASSPTLAVRPGVVYSANGSADLRLPAGDYVVYAGRGFEYSLATETVTLAPGQTLEKKLIIRRVVPTDGYAACDTHVHTLTYSRHGDATGDERMITLAGEGIELPVSTEHNLQVDYGTLAEKLGVRQYFTPLMGNEVTTASLGHFNVFPIPPRAPALDWRPRDWDALSRNVAEVAVDPVVVLNHARDVHGGFRPFDPTRHVSVTGQSRDGRDPPINAMEVVNSGATLSDPMLLFRDWFGLLNRGKHVIPVGASDSHDVARYVVGQARTYVRCNDADPSRIDAAEVRRGFAEGRVAVSYGLLADVTVDGRFGPGDLVASDGPVEVAVRVLGPEWTRVTQVTLYANGVPVRDFPVPPGQPEPAGLKWTATCTLPRFTHDVHLVVIATGPGITAPYWAGAKPYQPTSPRFSGYVLGATGAVWLDANRSGRFDSAYDYASRLVKKAGEPAAVVQELAAYDEAVAAQVAGILRARDGAEFDSALQDVLRAGAPATRRGFETFRRQWEAGG